MSAKSMDRSSNTNLIHLDIRHPPHNTTQILTSPANMPTFLFIKAIPLLCRMADHFFTVFNSIFYCFFHLGFICLNKKFQKHLGGVFHRVRIIELIVQSNLSHGEVTCLSKFFLDSTYYAHAVPLSTVKFNSPLLPYHTIDILGSTSS